MKRVCGITNLHLTGDPKRVSIYVCLKCNKHFMFISLYAHLGYGDNSLLFMIELKEDEAKEIIDIILSCPDRLNEDCKCPAHDFIAYGTGATDQTGYVDLLNEHFQQVYGEGTFNKMAANGVTSAQLLFNLKNDMAPLYQMINVLVSSADIITISIGGNDILQTVIGIDPETDLQQLPLEYIMNLQELFKPMLLSLTKMRRAV